MTNDRHSSSGGIGFCGALGIVFIVLKLTGYIDWSWVWVLSPIWIPTLVVLVVIGFCLTMAVITGELEIKTRR